MEKFSVLMSVYHRDNAVYLKEALNSIFDLELNKKYYQPKELNKKVKKISE